MDSRYAKWIAKKPKARLIRIGGGVEIANLSPNALGVRYSVLDLTMHTLRASATYRFATR